ncbi:MAG TPA: hypothetical protein VH912_29725 [Streptosporangiaceae bacterium]|jgi:hypothetical protein
MTNAVRALTGGPRVAALLPHSTAYYVVSSLLWAAAIAVVFGLVAALRFARR